jgi:hypothetical protein
VGEWHKDESWKFYDIWELVSLGVPEELRVDLWKDFLLVHKHEADARDFINQFGVSNRLSPY